MGHGASRVRLLWLAWAAVLACGRTGAGSSPRWPDEAPSCGAAAVCLPERSLEGRIDDGMARSVAAWLRAAPRAGAQAVVLRIDSKGGNIAAGLKLADAVAHAPLLVHCVVVGAAHSIAFVVLQACTTRTATSRSELMIHEPYLPHGVDERGLPRRTATCPQLSETITYRYAGRMKVSIDELREQIRDGAQWWFTPEQGVAFGALDGVVVSVEARIASLRAALERERAGARPR
jgi:ATP-dependent protease ClpP protease subunit